MKKVTIILSILAVITNGCGQVSKKTVEQTLKEFYTQYITECDKTPTNFDTIEKIKENFLTKALIQKLQMAELDYDPFLNAQDCDKSWIETIEIKPVTETENIYKVCYRSSDFRGEHTNCITLSLVKINGKYLINDIEGLSSENEQKKESSIETTENKELSEKENFVTESDWEYVKCRKYQEDDGYTQIQECVFPNANMQQVYDIIKKKVSDLKAELPTNDLKYGDLENGDVIVTYTYKEPKYLQVELSYNGGVTTVEIIEKENVTQSKITYSAD